MPASLRAILFLGSLPPPAECIPGTIPYGLAHDIWHMTLSDLAPRKLD
jgi:hypothetical protein